MAIWQFVLNKLQCCDHTMIKTSEAVVKKSSQLVSYSMECLFV